MKFRNRHNQALYKKVLESYRPHLGAADHEKLLAESREKADAAGAAAESSDQSPPKDDSASLVFWDASIWDLAQTPEKIAETVHRPLWHLITEIAATEGMVILLRVPDDASSIAAGSTGIATYRDGNWSMFLNTDTKSRRATSAWMERQRVLAIDIADLLPAERFCSDREEDV